MEFRSGIMRLPFAATTSRSPLSKVKSLLAPPATLKYRVGVRRGIVCLMGRRDSLALVGSPPRDGVSINIPVVVAPHHHYPQMSVMTTIDLPNNAVNETRSQCEGLSPGRCPMEEQRGPGRHPATAPRIQRRKWCQYDNRVVMECYYQSEPKRNGYRKIMHKCWVDKGMFPVTEQRLLD